MTDQEYIDAINAESVRRGFTDEGQALTDWAGPEVWLEAWRDDGTLTPAQQVQAEIEFAMECL